MQTERFLLFRQAESKGVIIMFSVGDYVIYDTNGVCKISGTEENDLGGDTVEYFVLEPVYDANSTFFVPKNNSALMNKMRSLLTDEEINDILDSVPEYDPVWIDDDNERKQRYHEILNQGDRIELAGLIKALYIHRSIQQKKGKKLHQSDEIFLKQAEKQLYTEFSLVLGLEPGEVEKLMINKVALAESSCCV